MPTVIGTRITRRMMPLLLGMVAMFSMNGTEALGARVEHGATYVKFLLTGRIGWKVNKSTGGDVCTIASGDECREGERTDQPGGFRYFGSVAVDPRSGDIYVADNGNSRVQELTAEGAFVAAFGWGVNGTKDKDSTATQAERNICTAESGDACEEGVQGTAAGQFSYPGSVTVDPMTGDLYIAEAGLGVGRVDKYTANGQFIWMIGKDVNKTDKGNICTEEEIERSGVNCGAGLEGGLTDTDPYAFRMSLRDGNILAVGGPEDLLYVAGEGRVQEFYPDGVWKREVGVVSVAPVRVVAIAVNDAGYVYVVYERRFEANVIREFDPAGYVVNEFTVYPRQVGANVGIHGLAVNTYGQLAVIGGEEGLVEEVPLGEEPQRYRETYSLVGTVHNDATGVLLSEFTVPIGNDGLTFAGDTGELLVAATDGEEILTYAEIHAASLVSDPAACINGRADEPVTLFDCETHGKIAS